MCCCSRGIITIFRRGGCGGGGVKNSFCGWGLILKQDCILSKGPMCPPPLHFLKQKVGGVKKKEKKKEEEEKKSQSEDQCYRKCV